MEIAVCTRCQSSNPVFTKFCLTCGLAITSDMKRNVVASAPAVATKTSSPVAPVAVSSEPATVTTASTATQPNSQQTEQTTNQPQAKGTGWLKSFFSK
jgi:hypothetical protein